MEIVKSDFILIYKYINNTVTTFLESLKYIEGLICFEYD